MLDPLRVEARTGFPSSMVELVELPMRVEVAAGIPTATANLVGPLRVTAIAGAPIVDASLLGPLRVLVEAAEPYARAWLDIGYVPFSARRDLVRIVVAVPDEATIVRIPHSAYQVISEGAPTVVPALAEPTVVVVPDEHSTTKLRP